MFRRVSLFLLKTLKWKDFYILDFDIVDTINPYPIPHNCLARPRLSSGLELKQTWQMCFFVQS